jgi:hypothetical protein
VKVEGDVSGGGTADCSWRLNPAGYVTVMTVTGPDAATFVARLVAQFKSQPAISGVGDEAHYEWDADNRTGALFLKVGAAYAVFTLQGSNIKDIQAATIGLAKLVVPKLGH